MGLFSPDPPDPPPVQPDPEPPKQTPDKKKKSEGSKKVQDAGEKARRNARRKGRSSTILTDEQSDTEALGRSRNNKSRTTKLGGA